MEDKDEVKTKWKRRSYDGRRRSKRVRRKVKNREEKMKAWKLEKGRCRFVTSNSAAFKHQLTKA